MSNWLLNLRDMAGKPTDELSDKGQTVALEKRGDQEGRRTSPAAARNRDVIRETFRDIGLTKGRLLEIGSGTGEHAVHIASAFPDLVWQPTDFDTGALESVEAWRENAGLTNILVPKLVDASVDNWPIEPDVQFDAVYSANVIHISPYSVLEGLCRGAGRYLKPKGRLVIYGPFSRNGVHTASSNADFDQSLKRRDARFGVRDLENDVIQHCAANALGLDQIIEMPANNLCVVFRK